MPQRQLPILLAATLVAFTSSVAWATDCNGNGVEDSCDISCANPGCSGVQGCGQKPDCNSDGVPDECELADLFAGTKGGGPWEATGGAKVFRYAGAGVWNDISPGPAWGLSAVMALAHFENHLYAGGQFQHGFANVCEGQVWRWDGGTDWTQVGSFGGSVTVLLTYQGALYAGTGTANLYRYDSPNWTLVGSNPIPRDGGGLYSALGFRSGIVTSVLCGNPEIVLGDLWIDAFLRYTPTTGLTYLYATPGSCIWDFAEYTSTYDNGRLYAGAFYALAEGDGPVYQSALPSTCSPSELAYDRIRSTGLNNWALEAFKGFLFVGGGGPMNPEGGPDPAGAKLWKFDGLHWFGPVFTRPTTIDHDGVSALAAHSGHLYVGLGLPDGWDLVVGDIDGRAEVWRTANGVDFELVSPSDAGNTSPFGGAVQCLLSAPTNDCDRNGVPDDCRPNGDGDEFIDACDNCDGTSNPTQSDCNHDGVGDACDPNCNGNSTSDLCDILNGDSQDCDEDMIPDECEANNDGDEFIDDCDNCPSVTNPGQETAMRITSGTSAIWTITTATDCQTRMTIVPALRMPTRLIATGMGLETRAIRHPDPYWMSTTTATSTRRTSLTSKTAQVTVRRRRERNAWMRGSAEARPTSDSHTIGSCQW